MNKLKKYLFPLFMGSALIIGTLIGIFASDNFVDHISPLGDIFVNLMFCIVIPLVFFTITSSIASIKKGNLPKLFSKTFIVFIITSAISAIFMLLIVLIIKPASGLNEELIEQNTEKVHFLKQVSEALTVNNFSDLLSRSHMLALIVFSIIFGLSLRHVDKENKITKGLEVLSKAMLKFVKIIMYYAPIGVCAYFATLVKSYGNEIIGNYLKSLIIYIVASILYFVIFYTLYAYLAKGKKGVVLFYKHILPSFLTSLATQSSLATLPTNLETAKEMEIDDTTSSLALPLGATIHMEGSAMGSILKIFFLFSIFNLPMHGVGTCLTAIIIAICSGVVMSGIPGGGLIGEMLIVSLYGFPASSFPMIATIGWLIDAPATMINACGDLPSCMLIEKPYMKEKKCDE